MLIHHECSQSYKSPQISSFSYSSGEHVKLKTSKTKKISRKNIDFLKSLGLKVRKQNGE